MLRTTTELRMLEHDLHAALEMTPPTHSLSEAIDPKVAAEFHDALDRMRHTLWAAAVTAAAPDRTATQAAVIAYRMSRVAEMLSTLRASGSQQLAEFTGSESFLEQVHAMAALTLEKHLNRKTPAA